MENLKLISLRVDTQVVDSAADFVASRPYWKKSSVMANLLLLVFKCASQATLHKMVSSIGKDLSQYEILFVKKQSNSEWSEEDESMYNHTIYELEINQELITRVGYIIDWVKSLKSRLIPQPNNA